MEIMIESTYHGKGQNVRIHAGVGNVIFVHG